MLAVNQKSPTSCCHSALTTTYRDKVIFIYAEIIKHVFKPFLDSFHAVSLAGRTRLPKRSRHSKNLCLIFCRRKNFNNYAKMSLTSIRTDGDSIEIIDQLVLPHSYIWSKIESPDDAYDAIKSMKIRGAPAIASLAALSVSSYLSRASKSTPKPQFLSSLDALQEHLAPILEHLYASRPTAVNLGAAITRLRSVMSAGLQQNTLVEEVVQGLISEGRAVADEDVDRNKTMARLGAEWILRKAEEKQIDISDGVNVLTVCNTGSLATSVGTESPTLVANVLTLPPLPPPRTRDTVRPSAS